MDPAASPSPPVSAPDLPAGAPLVVVCGPTASGKSALALHLAQVFHGEIVNCDSVQLYRGLDIGTAKTPPEQRLGIPHHLLDVLDPREISTAGGYARAARRTLAELAARGALPIVAGGTGFYLRALLDGLASAPGRDDALRQRLSSIERRHAGRLHRLLTRLDPASAARIHANDAQKIVRAVEICLLSRAPATRLFGRGSEPLTGFRTLKLVLNPDRARLHQRIAARSRAIYAAGLVDELRALAASGVPLDAKPFESIGYREARELLAGRLDLAQAIEATTIATRQYAKRQLTWFRRESGATWIDGFGDEAPVQANVTKVTRIFLASPHTKI
jgi:tRNA dimethylallyltransferase